MMQAGYLGDGRLHLHHGPIDLVIDAAGVDRKLAFELAVERFDGLLESLVTELPALRAPLGDDQIFADPVARRMRRAVLPHGDVFVTPMAAVAGAVADEVLGAMLAVGGLRRAYVNNGGDIALHLAGAESLSVGMPGTPAGRLRIAWGTSVRGVATSGWRGRSHSLGIADAVTVLARTAAEADVAATLIANAVDLPGHPAIRRVPARHLAPDSDLGVGLVTVDVGPLSDNEVADALAAGLAVAQALVGRGLIVGACLSLRDQFRVAGTGPALAAALAA